MRKFETFKEIEIGGSNKEELLRKLEKADVNLADLGLNESSTYDELEAQAQKLGLRICPLELGVYLRLEFMDQSEGPYLKVASKRLENSDDFPKGLYLRNVDNVLWLRGYRADGFEGWPENYAFILIDEN